MRKKITFGICTYNRKDILQKSARSLMEIDRIKDVNIRIYDDCSREYDTKYLRRIYPAAKSIKTRTVNVGSDANIAGMFEDFLTTGDDILFNADSDLIYQKNIVSVIENVMDITDGIISFFNTPSHLTLGEENDAMILKENVGSAGCCITRALVKKIIENIKGDQRKKSFDLNFCSFLRNEGIKILCLKESVVQHIGVTGQNTDFFNFDYGLGFQCDTPTNTAIVEDAFEQYICSINRFKHTGIGKLCHVIIAGSRRMDKWKKRR